MKNPTKNFKYFTLRQAGLFPLANPEEDKEVAVQGKGRSQSLLLAT